MAIDVAKARAETPGCGRGLHLDAAGSSLTPAEVLEAQVAHLRLEAEVGGYKAAELAAQGIDNTYTGLARLLGAERPEIAVIENATLAWNLALHSFRFDPGDRILTAEAEYASNYISYLRLKERQGVEVIAVPSTSEGELDVAALERLIDERVKLISVSHVPTNGGLVNPAAEIGRVARAAGIPFLLDACQSVGQLDLDVEAIGCDLLTASARKFLRGPRGIGFLYVRDTLLERLDPPFLDLHGARWETAESYSVVSGARRFETWEFNYAGVLGMAAAVDYALDLGLPAIEARVTALAAMMRSRLVDIPGIEVHDIGRRKCAIVSFSAAGRDTADLVAALDRQGIVVGASTPYSTRLDAEKRGLPTLVRASVHYYTLEEEIEVFARAVRELVA
jgi:selenocysteine lyase/cysteine desulfurase